jgi:hypothetical protein
MNLAKIYFRFHSGASWKFMFPFCCKILGSFYSVPNLYGKHSHGLAFWLSGAYAPLFKIHFNTFLKCIFNLFENIKKSITKCCACYVLTKLFRESLTFYVTCIKKSKFDAKRSLFTRHFLCLFTQAIKNVGFP